jgi:hypothetical protein
MSKQGMPSFLLKGQSEAIPSFEIQYSLFNILRFALEVSYKPGPLAKGQPD